MEINKTIESYLSWKPEYELNIEIIDNQHKKLVEYIQILYNSVLESNQNEITVKIIADLIDYTHYHFDTEENYFTKTEYPSIEEHKKEHKMFIERISIFSEASNSEFQMTFSLINFLKSWLINHILLTDKEYVKYLNL